MIGRSFEQCDAARPYRITAHEPAGPLASISFPYTPLARARELCAAIPELSARYARFLPEREWLVLCQSYDPTFVSAAKRGIDFLKECAGFALHPIRTLFAVPPGSHIPENYHFASLSRRQALALVSEGIMVVQWLTESSRHGGYLSQRMDVLGPPSLIDTLPAAYTTSKKAIEGYIESFVASRGLKRAA